MNFVKNAAAGAFLGGSLLFSAGLGMAHAQPADGADGLVNLAIGDVTLLDGASPDTVASAAAAICGAVPADVTVVATEVDGNSVDQTVCEGLPGGDLVIAQNVASGPAESPAAPSSPTEAPAPTPAAEPAPAPEGGAEGTSGSGEGLGAPAGTGAADGGSVPLPSDSGE
ncbi:hypothetical protein C6A87_006035 [Mycobacterium sp. ITM-2016-00317]|uniref:hypothetical protein n=1 Tax=Mycobacterium sp. ITM-2016-00317 TaxID=2099694 RepID=UPI000D43E694|nr:hypothetical protein [Mycobacterium sp. ITM-2016-00317]WNG88780.1 hypothetical protein C6A87_006035 [Mycobacterium sp. ITM-2016-00317]